MTGPHHAPHADGLVLQLLSASTPALDDAAFAAALAPSGWQAHRSGPGAFTLSTTDGHRAHVTYAAHAGVAHPDAVEAALSQTWDWPEAAGAVGRARATLVVEVVEEPGLDRARTLKLAQASAQAAMRADTNAQWTAIHWLPSERLVSPEAFVDSLEHGGAPCDHALNVRLFRVTGGRPGEGVMDTLGLGAFGLPDLECHFHGLDLGLVARLLFGYAEYLFDKGDVLNEESLVRGTASFEEWECARGEASIAPPRAVVRLLPDAANRP